MKKKIITLTVFLMCILFLSGCGSYTEKIKNCELAAKIDYDMENPVCTTNSWDYLDDRSCSCNNMECGEFSCEKEFILNKRFYLKGDAT